MSAETRQQTLHRLSEIMRVMTWQSYRQGMEAMERLGVTVPQAIMLLALEANGGRCTMRELAQLTQQAGATLTGITDRLVDAGLVGRERDEADRRVVYVALLEAGRQKIEAINAQRETDMERMMANFSDQELQTFVQLMGKFLDVVAPPDA
jgi:MarR family transcriptional regulator, organic hydroperoxide resistance regulator